MAITLTDLLDEKQVILRLRSRKVPNALREIIGLLAQNGKIENPEAFFEKVLAREQVHPSVVENGVAFPHARTDLVDEIVIGIGRSHAGTATGRWLQLIVHLPSGALRGFAHFCARLFTPAFAPPTSIFSLGRAGGACGPSLRRRYLVLRPATSLIRS